VTLAINQVVKEAKLMSENHSEETAIDPGIEVELNPQPIPPGVGETTDQPLPPGIVVELNPQPLPPGPGEVTDQPLPPGIVVELNPQPLPPGGEEVQVLLDPGDETA